MSYKFIIGTFSLVDCISSSESEQFLNGIGSEVFFRNLKLPAASWSSSVHLIDVTSDISMFLEIGTAAEWSLNLPPLFLFELL